MPASHTCFFTIDLPRYTTFEIARERIAYAVQNCIEIDTDGSASSALNAIEAREQYSDDEGSDSEDEEN
eukprot:TRINITY_DN1757_c0_g1_i1.p3 TRINITY_DN1757_c0_g1~~TRINITY_DN1757_c0_g1_i1.p3  ORF type:complete len:69 (+),score=16.28 TRINITY_DN1757_c0_g1_i1:307-513(+)